MRHLPEDNLAYPVAINIASGRFGSGFLLNTDNAHYLVTAKHVLFDLNTSALLDKTATGNCYGKDLTTRIRYDLNLEQLLAANNLKPHTAADVALLKLGDLVPAPPPHPAGAHTTQFLAGVTRTSTAPVITVAVPRSGCRPYADVLVSNEVFVFGYPNSIGAPPPNPPQLDPTRPLLRKGIVAGKNDTLKTIIVDCPVYQGNSGGLVMEVFYPDPLTRHFATIGIATAFIPFVEQFQSLQYGTTNVSIENSGYAVVTPIDRVLELL